MLGRRRVVVFVGAIFLLALSTLAVRAATTAPQRPDGVPPLEVFDPEHIGTVEQQAWEAYYYRDWPRLFQLLLELIGGKFGLSPAQALEAAMLATRAQIAWAEQGAAGGVAEDYMRQFYTLVREPSGGRYDPARAAALEVNWWAVHRNRAQHPDTSALVEALAALSAELYGLPIEAVRPAGYHRAQAMEASDRWIQEGKERQSPLLATVRDELILCYRSLQEALDARRGARPPAASQGVALELQSIEVGYNSGHPERAQYVITSATGWRDLWDRVHATVLPRPPLREIDFARNMVLAVFQGQRPSGGHRIAIVGLLDLGNGLEVLVREESPGRGCGTTAALTEPYHLAQAARVDKPVNFRIDQVVVDCN